LLFHATSPDGRLSQYVTAEAVNPSFPPPPTVPVNVVQVLSDTLSSQAIWTFDSPVSSVVAPDLIIGGVGGASLVSRPDAFTAIISYLAAPNPGDTWLISSAPATVPASAVPQTGSVS